VIDQDTKEGSTSTFTWITEVELMPEHNQIRLGATTLLFDDPNPEALQQVEALATAATELASRIRAQIGGAQ
jgi:hypothetical protein